MKEKVSKAQEEVWEWKEAVYQDIKGLSSEERIEFFRKRNERLFKELGIETVQYGNGAQKLRRRSPAMVSEKKEEY